MKLWTFYKEKLDNYWFPRWTYRCNNVDKSGVSMLVTVGPMTLRGLKKIAAKSGWTEDQPTQIYRWVTTERSVLINLESQLESLASKIKTLPKAGIQFA